jgi:hypothetical protein
MSDGDSKCEPLFQAAKDWQHNACVNPAITSTGTYAHGYLRAARLLVENVVAGGTSVDTLVYPIVFNYRQYLELRLKDIVRRGRQLSRPYAKHDKTHSLIASWLQVKDVVAPDLAITCVAEFAFVDYVLADFDRLDSGSYTFRYATDRAQRSRSLPKGLQHINVRHFAAMIERVAEVLEGMTLTISVVEDWADEACALGLDFHPSTIVDARTGVPRPLLIKPERM